MQLIIDIPDWVSPDETLTLLAGQELIAVKYPRGPLQVKTTRCDRCGECCLDIPEGHLPFGTNGEGKCNKLTKEGSKWLCSAGWQKPFACLADPPNIDELQCCIRYKVSD